MGVWAAVLQGLILYFLYAAVVAVACIIFCTTVGKKSKSDLLAGIGVSIFLLASPIVFLVHKLASEKTIQDRPNQEWNLAEESFEEFCKSNQETQIIEYVSSFTKDVMLINEDADTHKKNDVTDFQRSVLFKGSPFQNVYETRFIKDWLPEVCNDESASAPMCSDRKFGYMYYHRISRTGHQPVGFLSPPVSDMLLIRITPSYPSSSNFYEIADILIEQNGKVIAIHKIYRHRSQEYCPTLKEVMPRLFAKISSSR